MCLLFLRDPAFQLKAECRPLFGAPPRREKEKTKAYYSIQTFTENQRERFNFVPVCLARRTYSFHWCLEDTHTRAHKHTHALHLPTAIQAHKHEKTPPAIVQLSLCGHTHTQIQYALSRWPVCTVPPSIIMMNVKRALLSPW